MIPTRDIGTRYNGLATVPKFSLHVPASDETKEDVRKMLNQVKHLYFDRRYRQCATKCLELLEAPTQHHHPLIRTFLYFYAALAYDTLARSMHNHSVARIPSLQQSEEFYNKALATLPEPLSPQQDENRPPSPPKLALSLPAQDDQPNGRPSIPSMWDLNSTFDAFDNSSSASRRRSFGSSKGHSRTDSLVTDVSWTGNLDCDPFTDDRKPETNNYLSVENSSVKRPSPLQLRKARSSDSLLSQDSAQTDSPAQTPSRKSKNDYYDDNGLSYQFPGPPPATPPQTHGFVDMVEGTPIQWTTPSTPSTQHDHSDYDDDDDEDENNDPATPTLARVRKPTTTTTTAATETPTIQRTHPCPRLLFPRDLSSSSFGQLLPLPLNVRIQHYNSDLSAFRAQLVSHLLSIQSLKSGGSRNSTPGSSRSVSSSSTTTSTWSESTATNSGGAAEENRRRSAVMSPAAETANANGGRGMTPAEKADRIAEGRKRGWARERFDPANCRELARLALQECEA